MGGEAVVGGPLELPNRGALFCARTRPPPLDRSQSPGESQLFEPEVGGQEAGLWLASALGASSIGLQQGCERQQPEPITE